MRLAELLQKYATAARDRGMKCSLSGFQNPQMKGSNVKATETRDERTKKGGSRSPSKRPPRKIVKKKTTRPR